MHRKIICLLLASIHVVAAVPAEPEHDHEHDAQPPGTQAAPSQAAPSQAEAMQKMRAMHEKMMAAKTPAERKALMTEHMKAMHDGMMSMKQMDSISCVDGAGAKMRMNMMDMMMQMMRDQQAQ